MRKRSNSGGNHITLANKEKLYIKGQIKLEICWKLQILLIHFHIVHYENKFVKAFVILISS